MVSLGGEALDVDEMINRFMSSEAQVEENNTFAVEALKGLKSIESQECPICLDTIQDPVLIPECHHAG